MGTQEKRRSVSLTDDDTARGVVTGLVRKGIKLLALDFDKTIVSVHTAGAWRQGTPKLAEHVRPCFQSIIKAALENAALHVCVVTYSMQPGLIQDVLKMVLPKSDMSKLIIRGNSKDWLPQQGSQTSTLTLGKQQHIAWVTTDLFNRKHVIIQSYEILLLDDDIENVNVAQEFGHHAMEIPEEVSLSDIKTYIENLEVDPSLPVTPVN